MKKKSKIITVAKLTNDQMHHLRVEMMCEDITAILNQYAWYGDKKLNSLANKAEKAVYELGLRARILADVEVEE